MRTPLLTLWATEDRSRFAGFLTVPPSEESVAKAVCAGELVVEGGCCGVGGCNGRPYSWHEEVDNVAVLCCSEGHVAGRWGWQTGGLHDEEAPELGILKEALSAFV